MHSLFVLVQTKTTTAPSENETLVYISTMKNVKFDIDDRVDLYCKVAVSPGGGTPLYKVYRYVPPQRVWFLGRFGLKTGIDFDNYGLKSGRVFGAGNIYESLHTYFSSQYVIGTTN